MKTLGMSASWWFFKWPMYRKRIKMYYEKNLDRLAESYLRKVIPDTKDGSKSMIKWLVKKHKWTRANEPN